MFVPATRYLTFFTVDFQIDDHFLATVERRNIADRRLGPLEFGMNFIIGIRVQAAEMVIPFGIGKIAAEGVGPEVFQKHQAIGQGVFRFIGYDTANGAQLGFLLGILGCAREYKKEEKAEYNGDAPRIVHLGSPAFAGLLVSSLKLKRFCTSAMLATTPC